MKHIKIWTGIIMIITLFLLLACGNSSTPGNSNNTTATLPSNIPSPTTTNPVKSETATPEPTKNTLPKYGGKLKVMTGVLPDGIFGYPPDVVNGASVRITGHVAENLVKMGWDGQLTPLLAESWEVSSDKSNITFKLRKGVKFMDGTEFNAQAVKWNFDRVLEAKRTNAWQSIEVIDDYTIRIHFVKYQNINLQSFADSYSTIVSPSAFEKYGKQWMYTNIVSTAAFKISNFTRDVSVEMIKNPNYWQEGKPYLDALSYTFVPDNMTAWAYMQTGGADVWWTSAQYVAQALEKGFTYVSSPGGTMCLVPDSANPDSPWSNLKVRQAAEYAIDREAIAKAFGYGFATAPYQLAPAGTAGYDPNFQGRRYDPAKAKQLLHEAGYPNGFKTQLICQISSNTNNNEVMAIQAYLKAVGIDAEVNFYETAKYYEFRNGKWKNGLVFEPIAAFGNYNATLNMYFGSNSSLFLSLAKSENWLKALNETLNSTYVDPTLMRNAIKVFFDEAMAIPTSQGVTFWLLQPNSKIRDLGLLTRHLALFFNAEDAWFEK